MRNGIPSLTMSFDESDKSWGLRLSGYLEACHGK